MSMKDVPRTATFDDLRVGQWVAWTEGKSSTSGYVASLSKTNAILERVKGDDGTGTYIYPVDCERGEVTILRDAPAPPVQVRREDFDALVAAMGREDRRTLTVGAWDQVIRAARALIDNAVRDDS